MAGLAGDVTDPVVAHGLIEEAARVVGEVDHLVCNAGIEIVKPAIEYTPEEWDRVLAVNLKGAFQPA